MKNTSEENKNLSECSIKVKANIGSSISSSKTETNFEEKSKLLEILKIKNIKISDAQEILRKILSNKKLNKIEEEKSATFQEVLKKENITIKEAGNTLLPFADPTFDTTFKMLFGSKEHDNILISLLNSLLDLPESKKITALEIITEKLETPIFSYSDGESSVSGAVDVLCTTTSGQKIAVEMQRAKQPYFLARTQHYMSKLISVQVNEKSGSEYHREILDTYILVLEKQNLFTGQHELSDKTIYEIEVEPMVKQTKEVFPGNKMHWKFFELSKFKQHNDSHDLEKNSNLKYQWLEFLIDCSNQLDEPERDDLIKEGYNIMKMMQWSGDKKVLYWREQMHELDAAESQKVEKMQAFDEGKLEGKLEGILKTNLKNDIRKVQKFFKNNSNDSEFKEELDLLNKNKYLDQLNQEGYLGKRQAEKFCSIFGHIKDHLCDKPEQIYSDLGLLGESMNLDGISHCDEWSVYSSS